MLPLVGESLSRWAGSVKDAVANYVSPGHLFRELGWTYDPLKGYSKSHNSPWAGHELRGRVVSTYVRGKHVYDVERGVLFP